MYVEGAGIQQSWLMTVLPCESDLSRDSKTPTSWKLFDTKKKREGNRDRGVTRSKRPADAGHAGNGQNREGMDGRT